MIAPETGMKAGERYSIESVERAPQFSGFFLDGKYYLGPELQTAVGWLEGQNFFYDQLDPNGEPVYPDRIVGTITARTLELSDGLRLSIEEMPFQAEAVSPLRTFDEATVETRPLAIWQRHTASGLRQPMQPSALLVAGAALLVGLCLLAINRSGRRVK
ncbi:Short chain dehydrogenase [Pseudomonas sp. IT-232MI5]|uniref:short chain dehydrogenase n=1 Tax=unclassified Pseudomonas TaxID=196821 RepID=UPI000BA4DE75|nr:short chain dehydrogenase [Pseudomonas sp. Irchel 3H7]